MAVKDSRLEMSRPNDKVFWGMTPQVQTYRPLSEMVSRKLVGMKIMINWLPYFFRAWRLLSFSVSYSHVDDSFYTGLNFEHIDDTEQSQESFNLGKDYWPGRLATSDKFSWWSFGEVPLGLDFSNSKSSACTIQRGTKTMSLFQKM